VTDTAWELLLTLNTPFAFTPESNEPSPTKCAALTVPLALMLPTTSSLARVGRSDADAAAHDGKRTRKASVDAVVEQIESQGVCVRWVHGVIAEASDISGPTRRIAEVQQFLRAAVRNIDVERGGGTGGADADISCGINSAGSI